MPHYTSYLSPVYKQQKTLLYGFFPSAALAHFQSIVLQRSFQELMYICSKFAGFVYGYGLCMAFFLLLLPLLIIPSGLFIVMLPYEYLIAVLSLFLSLSLSMVFLFASVVRSFAQHCNKVMEIYRMEVHGKGL